MSGHSETWTRIGVRPPQRGMLAVIGMALDRHAQRRRLLDLDPRLLRDIGITPAEALAEARKPIWRP